MDDQLVKLGQTYVGGALKLSKNAPNHLLNYIMSVFIHRPSHFSYVIEYRGNFLYVILNSETINPTSIIYKAIVFHSNTPSLFTLHYPSLIIQWITFLFLYVSCIVESYGHV